MAEKKERAETSVRRHICSKGKNVEITPHRRGRFFSDPTCSTPGAARTHNLRFRRHRVQRPQPYIWVYYVYRVYRWWQKVSIEPTVSIVSTVFAVKLQ